MAAGMNLVLGDYDRERLESRGDTLAREGARVRTAGSGPEVLRQCREDPPDAVVLEVLLPQQNGFQVLETLKADSATAAVKVVVLVDDGDEYGRHRARLSGADRILERPLADDAIQGAVASCLQERSLETAGDREDETGELLAAMDRRAKMENPLIQHITDELTGLYNHAYMELKLEEELKKARRFSLPLSCIMIGLDDDGALAKPASAERLRSILNEVAGIMLCESRDIDHLARRGVQEFLMLLPHTDTAGATAMAGRILKDVEARAFEIEGRAGRLTASAGIASFEGQGVSTSEEFHAQAREAMAASRKWGGNRYTVWVPDVENAYR